MKSATSAQRPYQEVGAMIRDLIIKTPYNPGERLPPEREIAEMLDVTRTVVREALIMLEIKGLVEVRRGAGIYVLDSSGSHNTDSPDANVCNDAGPFELLQARQLTGEQHRGVCRPAGYPRRYRQNASGIATGRA